MPVCATAPLWLVLSGDEVSALGDRLSSRVTALPLELRATVTVSERAAGEFRSRVRGFGHSLLVEPDLEPPADEGLLAVEAWVLRLSGRGLNEIETAAPPHPELGSLEARAVALAGALGIPAGLANAAAARGGSPLGRPNLLASGAGLGPFAERLVLFRDPHAPPGPSARRALLAWYEGTAEKRRALERAAAASRAIATLVESGATDALPALVDEEALALEALAPPSERERRVEAALRTAGAQALRRLGERGLLLAVAAPGNEDALRALGESFGFETIDCRIGSEAVTVETRDEVSA